MSSLGDHELQQSLGPAGLAGCWKLAPGRALSLRPREAGVLRIRQGRAWATLDERPRGHGPDAGDYFLLAGEQLAVQPGRHLVIESLDHGILGFEWLHAPVALPLRVSHWNETVLQPLADLCRAAQLACAALLRLLRGLLGTLVLAGWSAPRRP